MGTRLNIKEITPDTEDWTCKVQVVDKTRPRDNKDRTKKYQLIILQDEQETNILALVFGGDITHFGDLFEPFHTYFVSVAQVKESTSRYGPPIYKFTWFIDLSTIVEPIEKVTPTEAPLPPPKHLTLTPFVALDDQQLIESEFDMLAIVVNGEPPKNAPNGKIIQEFLIMNTERKPAKFTFWEDFVDYEGTELFNKLSEYPIILAKRIRKTSSGKSAYNCVSNRYNTTIHIDPPYEQAIALKKWVEEMKPKLVQYTLRTTSASGTLIYAPFEEEIINISEIQVQPSGKIFYIQAEISLPNVTQRFCSLACTKCKLLYTRPVSRKEIICTSCRHATQLIPRCQFEVTVTDNSGSTIATISDEPAHKLLFLTLEEIYDIYCVKKQLLPLENVHQHLNGKRFRIQMRKMLSGKLSVLTYNEIDNTQPSQSSSIMTDIAEGSKRKFDDVGGKEAQDQTPIAKTNPPSNKENIGRKGLVKKH